MACNPKLAVIGQRKQGKMQDEIKNPSSTEEVASEETSSEGAAEQAAE